MTETPVTADQLQDMLAKYFAPWVQALDLTIETASPEGVRARMPLGDHLSRVGGIVSGQALAALSDTTMVLAAVAHAGTFRAFATTDLHTQFLRPGRGSAILCSARVVRAGKAMVFAHADMTEEDSGKPVAVSTASFYAAQAMV